MLIQLVIALIVVGALLYVASLLPIDATIKKIIQVVVILAVVVWVLEVLAGGTGGLLSGPGWGYRR